MRLTEIEADDIADASSSRHLIRAITTFIRHGDMAPYARQR